MRNDKLSTILSIAAVAGVVVTTALAIKATPKAQKIAQEKEINVKELKKEEYIPAAKEILPVYIPCILAGAATIACVVSANRLSMKQQVLLAGAYAALGKSAVKYKDKVKELFGSDADERVREEIAKDEVADKFKAASKAGFTEPEKLLFYDEYTDQYFEKTLVEVLDAEYQLNKKFITNGEVSLHEFYELLGIESKPFAKSIGWSTDAGLTYYGYQWIDVEHQLTKIDGDLACYVLAFVSNPTADYRNY